MILPSSAHDPAGILWDDMVLGRALEPSDVILAPGRHDTAPA